MSWVKSHKKQDTSEKFGTKLIFIDQQGAKFTVTLSL